MTDMHIVYRGSFTEWRQHDKDGNMLKYTDGIEHKVFNVSGPDWLLTADEFVALRTEADVAAWRRAAQQ